MPEEPEVEALAKVIWEVDADLAVMADARRIARAAWEWMQRRQFGQGANLRDAEANYLGKAGTTAEHRTTGGRAWCHSCHEWCYPEAPCGEPKCCSVASSPHTQDVYIQTPVRTDGPPDA